MIEKEHRFSFSMFNFKYFTSRVLTKQKIYDSFEKFISSIKLDNWIILYIFFELNLIKELGFDPNLIAFEDKVSNSSDIQRVKLIIMYLRYRDTLF